MIPRTVLLTGAAGQLGLELQHTVPEEICLFALDRRQLDITDRRAVNQAVSECKPDCIINAAAYTAVDKAESEPQAAYAVNAVGAANLARAAVVSGARYIHISTDFVFDGRKSSPCLPGDPTAPLGVYGASKLEGEKQVTAISDGCALIVRTSWLYSVHGRNFVKTMLCLMRERDSLGVVADQVGTPTWTRTLAEALWTAARKPKLYGIHHWSDAGVASWYDFTVAIQEEALRLGLLDRAIPVRPIRTEDYPTPAQRPGYNVLDKTDTWKNFVLEGRHWRVCLRSMLEEFRFPS